MARYPEEILRAGKSAQRVYDLAQGAESLAQDVEKKRKQLAQKADEIETKANELKSEKDEFKSFILQNEQQIRQAFQNWDTMTEQQFRTVTKLLFRALVVNEIKESQGGE